MQQFQGQVSASASAAATAAASIAVVSAAASKTSPSQSFGLGWTPIKDTVEYVSHYLEYLANIPARDQFQSNLSHSPPLLATATLTPVQPSLSNNSINSTGGSTTRVASRVPSLGASAGIQQLQQQLQNGSLALGPNFSMYSPDSTAAPSPVLRSMAGVPSTAFLPHSAVDDAIASAARSPDDIAAAAAAGLNGLKVSPTPSPLVRSGTLTPRTPGFERSLSNYSNGSSAPLSNQHRRHPSYSGPNTGRFEATGRLMGCGETFGRGLPAGCTGPMSVAPSLVSSPSMYPHYQQHYQQDDGSDMMIDDEEEEAEEPVHTQFHSHTIPAIDIAGYLRRITKYCKSDNEMLIAIVVYIKRIRDAMLQSEGVLLSVDTMSVHRLVISGFVIANKYFSDTFYQTRHYAKVGGFEADEINRLEAVMIKHLRFYLGITIEDMQRVGEQLAIFYQHRNDPQIADFPTPPTSVVSTPATPYNFNFTPSSQQPQQHQQYQKHQQKLSIAISDDCTNYTKIHDSSHSATTAVNSATANNVVRQVANLLTRRRTRSDEYILSPSSSQQQQQQHQQCHYDQYDDTSSLSISGHKRVAVTAAAAAATSSAAKPALTSFHAKGSAVYAPPQQPPPSYHSSSSHFATRHASFGAQFRLVQ